MLSATKICLRKWLIITAGNGATRARGTCLHGWRGTIRVNVTIT
jgi:hypothetical protein